MVSLLRLFEKDEILVEHLLLREGDPIDTGELLALLIPSPVGTCDAEELHSLDIACIRHVRATTEVGEGSLRIGRDRSIGQVCDQLELVLIPLLLEELRDLSLGDITADDRLLTSSCLEHLLLDDCEVCILELHPFTEVYIIVEAILNRRANPKLSLWINLLESLRHQVST